MEERRNQNLSRLPISNQELFDAQLARNEVIKAISHDINQLGSAASEAVVNQIKAMPPEEVGKVLSALEHNPASDVIRVISNGGFSEEIRVNKTKKSFNLFKAAYNFFTKRGTGTDDTTTSEFQKKSGFKGKVTGKGPSYSRPKFEVSAQVSEHKAAASSSNGKSGSATSESSAMSVATGENSFSAASSAKVIVNSKYAGGKINYGDFKANNDQD